MSSNVPLRYHFVNQSKTWDEAQKHCRRNFTDLATADDMIDLVEMKKSIIGGYEGLVWIGLRKTGNHIWRWSLQDQRSYSLEETNFTSWGSSEPDNGDCAAFIKGWWHSISCEESRYFMCYNGTI